MPDRRQSLVPAIRVGNCDRLAALAAPLESMHNRLMLCSALAAGVVVYAAGASDGWPHWRGPNDDGMAGSDAPLHWSDTDHIAWKATVPGHGNSSPVVWGDRIFVTTAVPAGKGLVASDAPSQGPLPGRPPGPPPDGQGPGLAPGGGPG